MDAVSWGKRVKTFRSSMLPSVLGLPPKYGSNKLLRNVDKYLPTHMVLFQNTLILIKKPQ